MPKTLRQLINAISVILLTLAICVVVVNKPSAVADPATDAVTTAGTEADLPTSDEAATAVAPENPATDPANDPALDPATDPALDPAAALDPILADNADLAATLGAMASPAAVGEPSNPPIQATGPKPTMESVLSPAGNAPSGTPRTFTLTFDNQGEQKIENARIWHQLLVAVDHDTTYEVTCTASGGAVCPNDNPNPDKPHGVPVGQQDLSGSLAGYTNTFWAVVDLEVGARLTFTVAVTSSVRAGACADSSSVMFGGYSRYSDTGFSVPADIKASASSVGMLTDVPECAAGAVTMTNKVAGPGSDDAPLRVLSGDKRTFTATWTNTTKAALQVPIRYSYYVPYTKHFTRASWSCTSSRGARVACPSWATGNAFVEHNNPGEEPDTIFEGTATLAAGEALTFTIALSTTLNSCTQDGVLRVQSYAERGATSDSDKNFKNKAPSKLVEIGCASWIVQESFNEGGVPDPNWIATDDACLTASTTKAAPGKLGECARRRHLPPTDFAKTAGAALPGGYLALTDDNGGLGADTRKGSVLYNRALPTKNGIVVEFDQYQYGSNLRTLSGDGIGFFLVDGNHPLQSPGPDGGSLGYASKPKDGSFPAAPGVSHGYLGVGFDQVGNFAHSSTSVAPHCTLTDTSGAKRNSVTLRGPGNGFDGYCPIGKSAQLSESTHALRYSGGAGDLIWTATKFVDRLPLAKRPTRVTVYPFRDYRQGQRITVEIDFGRGLEPVLDRTYQGEVPSSFKFGLSASTGLWPDAHMISNLRVGTVLPLEPLDLTLSINQEKSPGPQYKLGEEIHYDFLVSNLSGETVTGLQVNDPLISNLTCPSTSVGPHSSVRCTGSLIVSEADVEVGRLVNEATVTGYVDLDPRASATSQAVAIIAPETPDAERKVVPRGDTTFVLTDTPEHVDVDSEPLVIPRDPRKVTVEVFDPAAKKWVAVPRAGAQDLAFTVTGQGTWSIAPGNVISFKHSGPSRKVTALRYRATTTFGGTSEGSLQVLLAEGLTDLRVEKLDQDGSLLPGGDFALFAADKSAPGTPLAEPLNPGLVPDSAKPGAFLLDTVLTPGIYFLRETVAPPGYNLLATDIQLVYSENGDLTLVNADKNPQVVVQEFPLDDDTGRGFTVQVTDRRGMKLPLTGGGGTWPLTVGGLALLAVVIAVSRRQKAHAADAEGAAM